MKNFDYIQPENINSASKYLKTNNEALAFAGGTDLLGLIKDEIIAPDQLVNLKSLANLNYIIEETGQIKIGALTKLTDIEKSDLIKNNFTSLYESVREIATPQLKNVGTIGGNICQRPRCFYFRGDYDCIRKGGDTCFAITGNNKYHCVVGGDPCFIVHPSDSAVALLSLDAKFKIYDGKQEKIIPANEFFVLPEKSPTKENILKDGEILTEIIIPKPNKNTVSKFIKVKERGAWDFALVSIAGTFNIEGNKINKGRICFGGVAPIPWEEASVNIQLSAFNIKKESVIKLSNMVLDTATALDMNEYKISLAKNLIVKLFAEIFEDIGL